MSSISQLDSGRAETSFNRMKKGRIWLLLSLAAVVAMGTFLLSDLRFSKSPVDDPNGLSAGAKDTLLTPNPVTEKRKFTQKTDALSEGVSPLPLTSAQSVEGQEGFDEDLAGGEEEVQEKVVELVEENATDYEVEEEEGDFNPEEMKVFARSFVEKLLSNHENWREARNALLTAYKDGTIPQNPFVENEFWSKVGEVGGQMVADELLERSDPAFTKVLEGWGKADPQGLFDYFLELDLKNEKVQNYLAQTNNRELPFIDQFSSGILDGLIGGDKGKSIEDDQLSNISEVVDYFLENDSMKGESLMREFAERVINDRDLDSLKEWVSGYEKPELQAATVQRVIESGAFDDEPLDAVKFAHSLTNEKAKRTGLSSAYARLANGVNGHDPNLTAQELNAMKDGMDRDFALNGFAHGLVHSDPEAALKWADSIGNPSFRRVVVENISKRIKVELNPRSR